MEMWKIMQMTVTLDGIFLREINLNALKQKIKITVSRLSKVLHVEVLNTSELLGFGSV